MNNDNNTDFLNDNIDMTPDQKKALGNYVKHQFKHTHSLPFTGSAVYGAGAAIPTYMLSRYMGLGKLPSSLLAGTSGALGAIYGYDR